jgi:hypothetical protein
VTESELVADGDAPKERLAVTEAEIDGVTEDVAVTVVVTEGVIEILGLNDGVLLLLPEGSDCNSTENSPSPTS